MRRCPMHLNILVILIPLLVLLDSSGFSNASPLARTDSVTRSEPSPISHRADTDASDRPTEDEIPSTSTGDIIEEKAIGTDKIGRVSNEDAHDSTKVTSRAEDAGEASATNDEEDKGKGSNNDADNKPSGSKTNDQATSSEPVKDKVEEGTNSKPAPNTEGGASGASTNNSTGKDDGKPTPAAQFMEIRSFEFDEESQTGTINGDLEVRLLSGGVELGKPDPYKINRKYFVATTDPNPRAVGILKIVNLAKASNAQGLSAADTLTQEGHLWKKIDDKRFMWHKTIKNPTSGRNKEYRVLYRAMYDQVVVDGQFLNLGFLHEWAQMKELDDKRKWDPKLLPVCQKAAIEAHVRLANRDIGSTKFSLWSWVTDESCKHWFPYEASPAYSFDEKIGIMMTREVTVKGMKPLDKKDKKKHLELLKTTQFTKYFTMPEIQKAKEDLYKMDQWRADKSDRNYYPWVIE